jgi:hypothetical protein
MGNQALDKLENVYIPLLDMQVWGREFFEAFLGELGRSYVFSAGRNDLPEHEMALWAHWTTTVFIPANTAIAGLIESKRGVLEPLPPGFVQFLAYHEAFKKEFERWTQEEGEYRHPDNFPERFAYDLANEIRRLIRLAVVEGGSRIGADFDFSPALESGISN